MASLTLYSYSKGEHQVEDYSRSTTVSGGVMNMCAAPSVDSWLIQ
jgi:hypothetical protein